MARGKRNKHNDMEKEIVPTEATELTVSNDVIIIKDGEEMPKLEISAEPLVVDESAKLTEGITEPEAIKAEIDMTVTDKPTVVNSSNSWDLDPVAIKGGKVTKAEVIADNPFGKKVKTVIDKVDHNKNDERMKDSDLIDNIVML